MKLHHYERLLFSERPHSFTFIGYIFLIISIVFGFFIINSLLTNNFNEPEIINTKHYFDVALFTLFSIVFLSFKFIVTTHRISIEVFKFSLMQISKEQLIDKVQLQVPIKSQLNDSLRTKYKFFRQNKSDAEYWAKNGQLFFPNNQTTSTFNRVLCNYPLSNFSTKQRNKIFLHLQQYWDFDPNFINRSAPQIQQKLTNQKDIGNTPIVILLGSLLIPLLSHFLITTQLSGIHLHEESYLWMGIFIFFGILISYIIIKPQNKEYVFLSSCISGTFLGCCIYFSALQINRFYSESNHSNSTIKLKLTEIKHETQYWIDVSPKPITNQTVYIHNTWEGYNNQLIVGKTYSITISTGLFNDHFFNTNSFKTIIKPH